MNITAAQRESAFRAELAELLARHGAELEVTDDGRNYGMQSGVCRITMNGVYDKDGDVVQEYAEFTL